MQKQFQDASGSQNTSASEVLNQLIETFGAAQSDNPEQSVLDKVNELQETSKIMEDEFTKVQQALSQKE